MKDLKICYSNKNGDVINAEYDTIMSFTDAVESDEIDASMLHCTNIEAEFFENSLTHKYFETIDDLFEHCKNIMK